MGIILLAAACVGTLPACGDDSGGGSAGGATNGTGTGAGAGNSGEQQVDESTLPNEPYSPGEHGDPPGGIAIDCSTEIETLAYCCQPEERWCCDDAALCTCGSDGSRVYLCVYAGTDDFGVPNGVCLQEGPDGVGCYGRGDGGGTAGCDDACIEDCNTWCAFAVDCGGSSSSVADCQVSCVDGWGDLDEGCRTAIAAIADCTGGSCSAADACIDELTAVTSDCGAP